MSERFCPKCLSPNLILNISTNELSCGICNTLIPKEKDQNTPDEEEQLFVANSSNDIF